MYFMRNCNLLAQQVVMQEVLSVEINDLIRLLFSIESRVALQNSRCVQIQTTEYG